MMDATFQSVLRLWEQDISQKQIARRLRISPQKVCKILVTAGAIETEESKLQKQGLSCGNWDYLEPHALHIMEHIENPEIRAMHVMEG